ncbi:glucan phosphoethanolaminetransferase (alkaline phosphatase superfamily) [Cytobacillus horneckiae]|uniref:Uncharacterized protein n=1 Tax=Cytobacillus horneckiae TaxID=549687 RepID=A0A2N0ZDB2_9BACI|nr:hypothetical protein [Cytobacillus horneckiae]NRG45570.1 hypothetical protein [Bacillus sp. CRN 9]MBN6885453.1 hypothetical protein [Cytobacillus horneckiae]MCM3178823.1 hypothetical protein [Cytobacillus horneckiae]MEC1158770.1 hypothetical protein [Cytobacillus horneckiae]MED2937293.1 hypothetical protein [Cytobacillus horneckiae]
MLLIISLLMVLAYSVYFFISSKKNHVDVKKSFSKCIPMVVGMTSSLTIGLLMALWIPQMALSTIFAVVISAAIAVLIGLPFGTNGVVEAQASSLMGAMMGAMLGIMLAPAEITLMVIAMDIIYLLSILSMMLLLSKELKVKNVLKSRSLPFYLSFLLSIFIICTIGISQTASITDQKEAEPTSHSEHHH